MLTLSAILFAGFVFAQGPIAKGQAQFNLGVGFSSYGMPVYIGLDYGVHPDITIGGNISYRHYDESYSGTRYNHSIFGIFGNANYHFNSVLGIPSNWDFYAGLNAGFYIWNSDNNYPGSHSSGVGLGAQIGGRYYFNRKFGLNLEFGAGSLSTGRFGISIRL